MISFLEGKVESFGLNFLILDVNHVGYYIQIPAYMHLPLKVGDNIKIYTYLYLREDKLILFGFLSSQERVFFELLISTPGVGPKVGLKVLSKMTPDDFSQAVLREDIDSITAIGGIGNKLANKIILELKEKLKKTYSKESIKINVSESRDVKDAIEALKVLGYSSKKARSAIEKIQGQFKEKLALEELIRETLKII